MVMPLCVILVGFFGPLALMALRWRKIKRYGVGGGEFNQPFATIGDGGVPPGTVMQENFGDIAAGRTETGKPAGTPDRFDGQRWVIRDLRNQPDSD